MFLDFVSIDEYRPSMRKFLIGFMVSTFALNMPTHASNFGSEPIYPEELRLQCLDWILKIGESAYQTPGFLSVYERLLTFDAAIKTSSKAPAFLTITHRSQVTSPEQQLTIDDANYLIEFQQNPDSQAISLLANRYNVKGRLLVFELVPNGRVSLRKLIIRFDINDFTKGSIILEGLNTDQELSKRFSIISVSSVPL